MDNMFDFTTYNSFTDNTGLKSVFCEMSLVKYESREIFSTKTLKP